MNDDYRTVAWLDTLSDEHEHAIAQRYIAMPMEMAMGQLGVELHRINLKLCAMSTPWHTKALKGVVAAGATVGAFLAGYRGTH